MIKFGIKLWTSNQPQFFKQAVDLFKSHKIDFTELYLVPHSFNLEELATFQKTKVTLHSPHEEHGFNVFNLDQKKIELFNNLVIKTADYLAADYIVLHAGVGDNREIFKKNVGKIFDQRIIIENMPKISLSNKICFGHSLEQLKFINNQCGFNLCLDVAHAIKSAVAQKIDYREFLSAILREFNIDYFHICDGKLNNEQDEHFNLGEGDFDFKWLKKIILKQAAAQNVYLTFEVPKNQNDLNNDLKNIEYFKKSL